MIEEEWLLGKMYRKAVEIAHSAPPSEEILLRGVAIAEGCFSASALISGNERAAAGWAGGAVLAEGTSLILERWRKRKSSTK